MSYKFNPFTGNLDYFETGSSSSASFQRDEKVVDSAFLSNRVVSLTSQPLPLAEFVYLNGLLLSDDCYTIGTNEITFDVTIPFKVGHFIDIRYAT